MRKIKRKKQSRPTMSSPRLGESVISALNERQDLAPIPDIPIANISDNLIVRKKVSHLGDHVSDEKYDVKNITSEGKILGCYIAERIPSLEYAYCLCVATLSYIKAEMKKTGVSAEKLQKIKMQAAAECRPEAFMKRLESITKECSHDEKNIGDACQAFFSESTNAAISTENKILKSENEKLYKQIKTLENKIPTLEMNLRNKQEQYDKYRDMREKDVDRLQKEVLSLDHRLIEMERANMFGSGE